MPDVVGDDVREESGGCGGGVRVRGSEREKEREKQITTLLSSVSPGDEELGCSTISR